MSGVCVLKQLCFNATCRYRFEKEEMKLARDFVLVVALLALSVAAIPVPTPHICGGIDHHDLDFAVSFITAFQCYCPS